MLRGMSSETPIFSVAAVGFRIWKMLPEGLLMSRGRGRAVGRPHPTRAACARGEAHLGPDASYECGLYAHRTVQEARSLCAWFTNPNLGGARNIVLGAVALRGQSRVYEGGVRAED